MISNGHTNFGVDGTAAAPIKSLAVYNAQRNPEWTKIDDLITPEEYANGTQKMVILAKVSAYDRVRFDIKGECTVDWGDGSIATEPTTGISYYKNYEPVYADMPQPEIDGWFRYVVITITANAGEDFTYFRVERHNSDMNWEGILEVMANVPKMEHWSHIFNYHIELLYLKGAHLTNYLVFPSRLKYYDFDISNRSSYSSMLSYCIFPLDVEITLDSVTNLSNLNKYCQIESAKYVGQIQNDFTANYMFGLSYIEVLPSLDWSRCYDFRYFLYYNKFAKIMPLIDMSGCTTEGYGYRSFYGAQALQNLNIINCEISLDFTITRCLPLAEIIRFGLNGIVDRSGEDDTRQIILSASRARRELIIMDDNDSTITVDGVTYDHDQVIEIFTDKNWDLVL